MTDQTTPDLVADLTDLFARFEAAPESARQELLCLFDAFLAQLAHSRVEAAPGASGGIGGLQLRPAGIAELRTAALRALDFHLGSAHG